jgi:single-strand DNA-binding protein
MRSVNKVILLGRVGQEPKIFSANASGLVASLSLATSYRTKEKGEITEWHRLTAFGRTAEIIRDYVVKGSALYVEGNLQTRKWDKDGETRYTTEIIIRDMSLLNNRAADASKSAALNGDTRSEEITDDDIPF